MKTGATSPSQRRLSAAIASQAPDLNLLAIGTSTEQCSVAVWSRRGGAGHGIVIDSASGAGQSGHVLAWVREALAGMGLTLSQIDAIAFDAGPGAFTGLRIGCGVAQGLGFTLDRPLVPVTSLLAMAAGDDGSVGAMPADRLIAVDARMQEFYWAFVPANVDPLVAAPEIRVGSASQALEAFAAARAAAGQPAVALGNGFVRDPLLRDWVATGSARCDAAVWADAGRIALVAERLWQQGQQVAPEQAAPVYVRNKVALDSAEQARLREANRERAAAAAGAAAAGTAGQP